MPPPPPKILSSKHTVNVTLDVNPADDDRAGGSSDWRQRPRAESLDVRYGQKCLVEDGVSAPFLVETPGDTEVVPPAAQQRRRRSASCSVLPPSRTTGSGPTFDPILEESVGQELQRILEGDPS